MTPEQRISKLERKVKDLDALIDVLSRELFFAKHKKVEVKKESILKPHQREQLRKFINQ